MRLMKIVASPTAVSRDAQLQVLPKLPFQPAAVNMPDAHDYFNRLNELGDERSNASGSVQNSCDR